MCGAIRKHGGWARVPLMLKLCHKHKEVVDDIGIFLVRNDGSLAANSPLDMVWRTTLLSFDALLVCPLIALALLVEGVIRAFVGGALFFTSYIPCTGQGNVKAVGKALRRSSVVSGIVAGIFLWNIVKTTVVVTRNTVKYLWDTACCTKAGRNGKVDPKVKTENLAV